MLKDSLAAFYFLVVVAICFTFYGAIGFVLWHFITKWW